MLRRHLWMAPYQCLKCESTSRRLQSGDVIVKLQTSRRFISSSSAIRLLSTSVYAISRLEAGTKIPLPSAHEAFSDYKWVLSWMMGRLQWARSLQRVVRLQAAAGEQSTVNQKTWRLRCGLSSCHRPALVIQDVGWSCLQKLQQFYKWGHKNLDIFISLFRLILCNWTSSRQWLQ